MKNSQNTIFDAICNNFNVSQLEEAFKAGEKVDNDQDPYAKNTFYSFTNQINNQEGGGKKLDKENIKEFFDSLLKNGLELGKEDLGKLNESKMSEELNQVRNDHHKGFVGKKISHFEALNLKNNSKDNEKGGHGI